MPFDAETVAILAVLGIAIGAIGTLVGAGGGFLLAPILLILYPHDSPETLTSISLAAVFANSTSGSIAYLRQRRVDIRSGLVFGAATLPGSVAGVFAVSVVSVRAFDGIMAVTLGAVAVWLTRYGTKEHPVRRAGTERRIVDVQGRVWSYRVPLVRGALYSTVVGFASSFLGIGGGVFHVPILVAGLGFPTHIATATSHFVLMIMSGSAVITHAFRGAYTVGHGLRRSLVLAIGLAIGAQIGARVSLRVPALVIERLLAAALALVAVRLAILVV